MTLEWSDSGVEGSFRFLKRLWNFGYQNRGFVQSQPAPIAIEWSSVEDAYKKARRDMHLALKQANQDFQKLQFNTVVSAAMKMLNALEGVSAATRIEAGERIQPAYQALVVEGLSLVLRLLSPIVPHIAHSLWRELQYGDDILRAPWPEHDPNALLQDEIEFVVQVNGKVRARVIVPANSPEERVRELVLTDESVQKHIAGKAVRKTIVVPGKLVNVVVG
jgi:leucyl-tRNA synthetase